MKEAKKELTVLNQYAVVTLHRAEDKYKLFLTPGAHLDCHTSSYVKEGWSVFSVELCNKEDYFNHKIDDVVESYNDICKERERLHKEFRAKRIDLDTYMTARAVTDELLEGDMRRLYRLMTRLMREDLDCHNEEAHGLYNMVF